ncbi:hypothetical protein DRQ36_00125 [bacterium]|nr:MAG: hypothetical protein DRQ36_00125 [bacterium]
MEDRMLDIVVILAERFRRDRKLFSNPKSIRDELIERGYMPEDIDRAIQWASNSLEYPVGNSTRILSAYERSQFTSDGCGLLLKLRNLGLLNDEHLELIIARSILMDEGPIDAEGIRSMAMIFLFDLKNHESGFPIYLDSGGGDIEN